MDDAVSECVIEEHANIFINRFKSSLERINNQQIESIIEEISQIVKNNDSGKEFYNWLTNPQDKVKLIDFDNIENNDFAVC